MRIVAFSDTHSYHRKVAIPDGDVLVCAGDITFRGELPVIEDFCNWMKAFPHPKKIVIHGNHETGHEHGYKRKLGLDMFAAAGITYLQNSMTEVNGYKVWGSPYSPRFFDWEYNRSRGKEIAKEWAKIDPLTNILITHGPPRGILDLAPRGIEQYSHEGCDDLLARIQQLPNLKCHIFGHIHRDQNEPPVEINGVIYANASILNNKYEIVNDPVVIDL